MATHFLQNDAEQLLALFARSNEDIINLSVAENILLLDRLDEIFTADCCIKRNDIKYQPSFGAAKLLGGIAAFLSRSFKLDVPLTDDQVSCFAGTRSALEVAAQALFDDPHTLGRAVLIPTPHWQGFNWIYRDRLGGRIVPVPLHSENDFALDLDAIKDAYRGAGEPKPRALVLTNPNNPLGINYEQALLKEIFEWVLAETEMHIFSDEIYAHCQMDGIDKSSFVSALALPMADEPEGKDRIHVFWGFAKDFGLSGFRIGVLASRNERLQTDVRKTPSAGFSPMTSSNSWFVRNFFFKEDCLKEDYEEYRGADELMKALAPLLKERFQAVTAVLEQEKIPYFQPTHAAQFVWLDLRKWLGKSCPKTQAQSRLVNLHLLASLQTHPEEEVLNECLAGGGVSLLPGQTLSTSEPGFFRLCYTADDEHTVKEAVNRIAKVLKGLG